MTRAVLLVISAVCAGALMLAVPAQQSRAALRGPQAAPLTVEAMYQGWRATDVLGARAINKESDGLGTVRNILIGKSGRIEALIIESAEITGFPEFAYRVPWSGIEREMLPGKVVIDIPPRRQQEYGLVPDERSGAAQSSEFPVTEVVGDYARLRAGQAYGYVSDVVFADDGRMLAVLVVRDAAAGGGTFAFGFPGTTGRWNPAAGYYGLPYVTARRADAAAVRVDPKRFGGGQEEHGQPG